MYKRCADRVQDRPRIADVVSERGDAAIERVRELTGGQGAHSVLECVGHGEAMRTAVGIARAGGAVGRVGVPQELTIPEAQPTFYANIAAMGSYGEVPGERYRSVLDPYRDSAEP